jgi:signal recognition particle subunit SRP19
MEGQRIRTLQAVSLDEICYEKYTDFVPSIVEKALLNAIASLIQPQCGGKPPLLVKKKVRSEQGATPKAVSEKGTKPVNNKNAASKLLKKGRRVSDKVKAEDRIKGSRPPPLSARYPVNSPARETGMLNADMGGMMGGLQGMGPLGAMMGQMGMGGDDDDDAEAEAEKLKEEEEKKKKKDPMQQLSRRQKKRVVRIGR